jgi:hypothetical protein
MNSCVPCQTFATSGSKSLPIGLEKLSGEEPKAAKLAAFEQQINPANSGLQCHRLDNIKDTNF